MRYLVLLMVVLLQVPVASLAEEIDAGYKISGNIAFGGLNTTGNSATETYDGKLELGYQYQAWNVDFVFTGLQTKDAGKLTSDYYEADLKTIYNVPWQLYAFFLFNYREDVFGGIYNEDSTLLGVGYHVFSAEETYLLDFEFGKGRRNTNKVLKTKIDHDPIQHLAVIASYTWMDAVFQAKWQTEEGNDDSYITENYSLTHKLFHSIEVSLNYESRTQTAPNFGKTGVDTKTTVRFGYSF